MNYDNFYKESIENKEAFWKKEADKIAWFKKPETILSKNKLDNYEWFADGELNTCYLAIDKHINDGNGGKIGLIYDSPVSNQKIKFSYLEIKNKVSKIGGALKQKGVKKGDTVIIYMPMIPEAVFAMLACARIGAIHSVVFGGFAAQELAVRIDDAKPKVIISASCGIEFDRQIAYKPLLDLAISLAHHKPNCTFILQRPICICDLKPDFDFDLNETIKSAPDSDCETMLASDPLYILYTSGTTGKPKGILRDNGGHAVAMNFSIEYIYDLKPSSVFWAASDVGWVVGHSYIVYAPLISGCTTILFEGKPIKTPDPGTFWRIIEEHQVNVFFTAPTAFRAIRKEDPNAEYLKKYNIDCLKTIFVAGERCDPSTLNWLIETTKKPIIDHWWQTETGWAMVANMMGLEYFAIKEGSATKPVCGYQIEILNEAGETLGANEEGFVCAKLPLPPGCLPTLWNDNERYHSSYLERFPGYYLTGDGGFIDQDGYVFIMGRVDDVINVSGHRLSTGEMEEIISNHNSIAECAVIGIDDSLSGQKPVGIIVLKDANTLDENQIEAECIKMVREKIGAVAAFKTVVHVKRLPKTRSGKILRKTMRMIADNEAFTIPSTIDDPLILDEIKEAFIKKNIGKISIN